MSKDLSKSRAYYRRRIRASAAKLIETLDSTVDYPPLVIAMGVACLVQWANGLCGPDLWRQIGETMQEVSRDRCGFCQHCDNECPPSETHPFTCSACDAATAMEADRMSPEG